MRTCQDAFLVEQFIELDGLWQELEAGQALASQENC
jgi:hypothetical protein